MSQTYEVIKTNGERYKTVYSKYEEYFDDFYDYEISITNHIRTKSHDGRPSSYRIFVVKSLYLYQQKFGSIPATLTDIDFIDKFLSIGGVKFNTSAINNKGYAFTICVIDV